MLAFVFGELRLADLFHPGIPEEHDDAGGLQVFVGFEFLPEVEFQGAMNGKAQSQRTALGFRQQQPVLEPPAGLAVEKGADLAGREDRRRFESLATAAGRGRGRPWSAPLPAPRSVPCKDSPAGRQERQVLQRQGKLICTDEWRITSRVSADPMSHLARAWPG